MTHHIFLVTKPLYDWTLQPAYTRSTESQSYQMNTKAYQMREARAIIPITLLR